MIFIQIDYLASTNLKVILWLNAIHKNIHVCPENKHCCALVVVVCVLWRVTTSTIPHINSIKAFTYSAKQEFSISLSLSIYLTYFDVLMKKGLGWITNFNAICTFTFKRVFFVSFQILSTNLSFFHQKINSQGFSDNEPDNYVINKIII